jgi:hypothetical protein
MALALAAILNTRVLAHHSLAAEYDQNKVATIKGTISEVTWRNPHASITLAVKNPDGSVRSMKVEIAPPGALTRKGFDPTILKIGDTVTIEAWMPKDSGNTNQSAGRTITLGDGRQFDIADSWMWQPLNATAPAPIR